MQFRRNMAKYGRICRNMARNGKKGTCDPRKTAEKLAEFRSKLQNSPAKFIKLSLTYQSNDKNQ